MHNANTEYFAGHAGALLLTLGLAVAAAFLMGPTWQTFGVALGGQVSLFLWLAYAPRVGNRVLSNQPPRPHPRRGAGNRRHRLLAQLRDVRAAVDVLPDAVVLLDGQGKVRWFNAAATLLLGLRQRGARQALPDQPLAEQLAGTELGAWLKADAGQPSSDMPGPVDGSLHLGVTVMPFGSRWRLLLARDISTLSRLEQVRRDFVANVSHELRTPLTVIHGYLELLDPADAPELAPVLGEMRVQSHRMAQIVEDLLTLSRLETREALPDETVNMAIMLETLRREATALSKGRHTIAMSVQSEQHLRGSIKDLHSAFSNLVSNAVRYTPSGGEITIGWGQALDGSATFWVRDSGLGISSEHLSRLTERFYRVSSSRSRESGGTGLGLSIVKHVLSLHQGRLVVESEPGHGSTFSCVLNASRLLLPKAGEFNDEDSQAF